MITNSQQVAEQIKIDNSESIVMDEPKIGEAGGIERQQNLKSIVMDGVKFGKVGKLKIAKLTRKCVAEVRKIVQVDHKMSCKTKSGKHTILANAEEAQEREQDVVCFDDVTGKAQSSRTGVEILARSRSV